MLHNCVICQANKKLEGKLEAIISNTIRNAAQVSQVEDFCCTEPKIGQTAIVVVADDDDLSECSFF